MAMRKQTGNSGTVSGLPLALLLIVAYKYLVAKSNGCEGGERETEAKPSTSPSVSSCFWHINLWPLNCVALILCQQCTSEPWQSLTHLYTWLWLQLRTHICLSTRVWTCESSKMQCGMPFNSLWVKAAAQIEAVASGRSPIHWAMWETCLMRSCKNSLSGH